LVEAIRGGAIPEVVRRKACRGELPVCLREKIEILVLLAVDNDDESRNTALHTLESWPPAELQQVLSDLSTPAAVLEFLAYNLAPGRKDLGDALLRNPSLPSPLREWMDETAALFAEAESSESSPAPAPLQSAGEDGNSGCEEGAQKHLTVLQRIHRMSAVQKVKAALTGSQEERMILVRDPNKLVARAVLQSPKISDHEVENIASLKDVNDEVLRRVVLTRKFMKSYAVIRALLNNPRTPIDVGLPLVRHINDRDLKWLAVNRNVSDVIRATADKLIKQKQEANNLKLPGKY
jgi:hypothetical protein